MLDAPLRPLLDRILNPLGSRLADLGISANAISWCGFCLGIAAMLAISQSAYFTGLGLLLLNRLADGLDGAVARNSGLTDYGGYLDIVLDFIIYSAIPFGFAFAEPENALAACFLVFSFVGTGSSFLAYAIIAAKRGEMTRRRGSKSFYFMGGLTEGTETIMVFALMCLWPDWFSMLALIFGVLCWITTATRIAMAWRDFADSET